MIKKIIMYVSAFLPMLLIMWVKEILLYIKNILDNPCRYTWKSLYTNPYLIVEASLLLFFLLVFVFLMRRNKKAGVYAIKVISVKNRSAEYYLAYYSLFILALIEFSLTDPIDIIVLVMLLLVLGVVYIKNELFFMNLTINIFQSYIYEIEYECGKGTITKLIISSKKIFDGETVDIDISEFEFTFLRKKHEQRD